MSGSGSWRKSSGEGPISPKANSEGRRAPYGRLLVRAVGFMTLGSGIVNIISAAGRDLPGRLAILTEVFPLEFLHISRYLSLLTGFALAVSSVNIFKRKKRAYRLVMLLAGLSVVFHLAKGLDYEEAASSLLLMAVLFLARKSFAVKSSIPDLRSTLARLTIDVRGHPSLRDLGLLAPGPEGLSGSPSPSRTASAGPSPRWPSPATPPSSPGRTSPPGSSIRSISSPSPPSSTSFIPCSGPSSIELRTLPHGAGPRRGDPRRARPLLARPVQALERQDILLLPVRTGPFSPIGWPVTSPWSWPTRSGPRTRSPGSSGRSGRRATRTTGSSPSIRPCPTSCPCTGRPDSRR